MKKENHDITSRFKSIHGEDFDLEERRMKYGYYNDRSEAFKEAGTERK